MTERKLTSVGVLANKLNMQKSKLAYYDILGLISPMYKTTSQVKLYDEDETIKTITKINKYKEEGFTLQQIKLKLKS